MRLSDFDFDLPEHLIATRPAKPRRSARLAVARGDDILDRKVSDLPDLLMPGDLLVLNDTKVIPAQLHGIRQRQSQHGKTQAKIGVTLLEPQPDGCWSALVKPLKKLRIGEQVTFGADLDADLVSVRDGQAHLRFNFAGEAFEAALARIGAMPLPPYIAAKRPADGQDKQDYQSVFARNAGAVAAPTASLHFDDVVLGGLKARGVEITFVTLHVGAGTFLPVTVEDVASHKMHAERGQIDAQAANDIARAKAEGRRVIPVGTTALRLIESAASEGGTFQPWQGSTDIFIYPGFQFQIADALMTNFHLPKSTLMMLVSALMGRTRINRLYAHAVAQNYRFFSYGDASLLIPPKR